MYEQTISDEKEIGSLLVQFEKDYPGVMKGSNVDEIAGNLQKNDGNLDRRRRLSEGR